MHVPEGATPKDGPSAGVAMVTAIVSVMTGIPVRKDVAMTGEITLRGRVLPIGGLKEKLLAAHRGGIKTVLIPEENAKDLTEISDSIKGGLEIIPVSRMDEVLKRALVRMPEPIEWDETAKPVTTSVDAVVEEDGSGPDRALSGHRRRNRNGGAPAPPFSFGGATSTRTARLDRPVAHQPRRAVFAHHRLDALTRIAAAHRKISSDVATAGDQRRAVGLALAVVAGERRRHVAAASSQRLDEAFGIDGSLQHAACDMRPGDEGCVPHQRDPAERNGGQLEIEDRLQDDLRGAFDQRRKLRRQKRIGVALDRVDQLRANERRRDRNAMSPPGPVGAQFGEGVFRRGAKPDEMTGASGTRRAAPASAIDKQQLAVRKPEHHPMQHQIVQLG